MAVIGKGWLDSCGHRGLKLLAGDGAVEVHVRAKAWRKQEALRDTLLLRRRGLLLSGTHRNPSKNIKKHQKAEDLHQFSIKTQ